MGKTATIRIKTKKPFIIRSKKIGEISLHSFVRTIDLEILLSLLSDKSLDARVFTVKVLNQVALLTPNQHLSSWDNKTLLTIARRWSEKVLFQEIEKTKIENFEDFRTAVSRYITRTHEMALAAIKGLQIAMAENLKAMITPLSESMASMRGVLKNISDVFKDFSSNLIQSSLAPFISETQKSLSSIKVALEDISVIKMLEESEYELAYQLIDTNSLLKLRGKNFKPVLTNKLVSVTKQSEFAQDMEALFQTTTLKKRLPAIKQALIAHQSRQYYLSTPVFIAQAEGIFTDWLILSKLVRRKNGKIYPKTIKKDSSLNSLNPKIKYVKNNIKMEGFLELVINNVLARMVSQRNAILHGEKSNYGTAKNSTQALLLVIALAGIYEDSFETKKEKEK